MHDTRYPLGHEEGSEKRSRAKGCKADTTSDKERTSQVSYVRLFIIFFRAFRVCYHTTTTSIPYCIESEIGFIVNHARALSVVGHRQKRRGLKGPVPRLCHSSGVLVCMYYLAGSIGNVQQVGQKREPRSNTTLIKVRVRGALATGEWDPPGARCLWICTTCHQSAFLGVVGV